MNSAKIGLVSVPTPGGANTTMADYKPTIGLEIHAELKTQTKLFCNSKNDPDEARPNTNICPICMGYPGTLPTINEEAIRHMVRIGAAVGGKIATLTYFDRKNYFYPDIPKGYQISQYKHPIVLGGSLAGVSITRVHLEEDTARSQHAGGDDEKTSLIDFNRAGVPLMELVTEPVVTSAEEAGRFARELQLLLRYLDAGDANMEKGEMRVEANVSVAKDDSRGTKVEVKNLNSFRSVERAIAHEIARQSALLDAGREVTQETRGWNEIAQETYSQRLKEGSEDYRYFPEPDLTMFDLTKLLDVGAVKKGLPELPWEKRQRYIDEHGLTEEAANIFVRSPQADALFSGAVKDVSSKETVRAIANYVTTEIPSVLEDSDMSYDNIEPGTLADLAEMKQRGDISSRGVKEILIVMLREGGTPEEIAKQKGLLQKSDAGELASVVANVIAENESAVKEYKAGKETALQFLIGQGMKVSKGSANPNVLKKLFMEKLR